jgi:integrase
MGTIFSRGSIQYIRYYDPVKGYTVTESTGMKYTGTNSANYKKAMTTLRAREYSKDTTGAVESSARTSRTSMNDLFEMLRTDYINNERHTLDEVDRKLKLYLKPFFGNLKAVAVGYDHIERYKKQRKQARVTNATINRELSMIRKSFRLGVKAKKLHSVPVFDMLDERDNVREGFLEVTDFLKVHSFLPLHLQPLAEFCYSTAWRKGEVLTLLWQYVNRVDCVITLPARNSKNKKQRTLEYGKSKELNSLIELQWKRKCEIETRQKGVKITHVFFHQNGRRIKDFRRAWKTACDAAGVSGKLFHDLRRSAIRNMLKAGITEKRAMRISGHATRSVFDRYSITDRRDHEADVAKIGISTTLNQEIECTFECSEQEDSLRN